MSKSYHPQSQAATPTEPPKHLHVKVEEFTMPQIFTALSHICADVNGGLVSVRKGTNGDHSRDVQKAFVDLRVSTSSQDRGQVGKLLAQICRTLREDRVVFYSNDGAARGRIIHLRDIKRRFEALNNGSSGGGHVSGSVDGHPAVVVGARA